MATAGVKGLRHPSKTWIRLKYLRDWLTVLKNPFNVEPVGGTCFIICTTFQVAGKLPGSSIVYQTRVALADGVLCANKNDRNLGNVGVVLGHLGVVWVDGIKAHLVLETEDEDDGVDPVCELWRQHNTQSIFIHKQSQCRTPSFLPAFIASILTFLSFDVLINK